MKLTLDATDSAANAAFAILADRPSALITDIDGTISAIVPRPEDAVVSDAVRESLQRLGNLLELVAIITARQEVVAREMVGVPELTYVGNYALDDSVVVDVSALAPVLDAARPLLERFPCVELEDKGVAFSLHYRNCDEHGMREQLLQAVAPVAVVSGARVQEGKQVVEVVPGDLPHKGTAIARLLRDQSIRGVVYMGDDLGDIPVFREIKRRRAEDGLPGLGIAVADTETPLAVREAADTVVLGVGAVTALLDALAKALGQEGDRDA